jgi:carboxypeptidase PM20D1
MKIFAWAAGIVLAIVVAVVAIVVVNTETFSPPGQVDLAQVRLAPPMTVDVDRAARHLGEAISFRTVTNQNAADNDWTQWDGLRAWLARTYPAFHAATRVELAAGRTLVFTWQGSDPKKAPIILMAHQDVVPVSAGTEADWSHPPFSGAIAEGAVWGRGAYDDKGVMIGLMEAVDALVRSGFKPTRTIYVILSHNEEVKGDGALAAATALKARGVKAEWLLDEGSFIEMDEPITGGRVAKIAIAEKGFLTVRLTAKGAGGHSSRPPKETAVATLARAIVAITGDPFPLRVNGVVRAELEALAPKAPWMTRMRVANLWLTEHWLATELAESPSAAAALHTTIAPTMLQGSPKANVLPQVAIARINLRIDPEMTTAEAVEHMKDAIGDLPVTIEYEDRYEPIRASSTTSDGWKAIAALARDLSGGAPVVPTLFTASTDSSRFPEVARDIYRFSPVMVERDKLGKMMHGTNEHMTLENLKRVVDFYQRLIRTTAG